MDFEKLILENMDNAGELERLYNENPGQFAVCFDKVFKANPESVIFKVWNERLHFKYIKDEIPKKGYMPDNVFLVIVLSLFAGTIAKLPDFVKTMNGELFYSRNMGFIVLPILALYFIIKNPPGRKIIICIAAFFIGSLIYINALPNLKSSHSIVLSCIHLPFFLWSLTGLSFIGDDFKSNSRRMNYLKYNGEMLIYSAILLICGMILTGLTIALFSAIGLKDVGEFYIRYIVVYGMAAAPVVATYLTETRHRAAKNIAPVMAKIFGPLVLITLIIYLFTIIILHKSPYTDRDFLINFNMMLVSVLAILTFTISERESSDSKPINNYVDFSLVVVTLIIDLIALSAIMFRLTSYGMSPNRIAVLGANILIFINLAGVFVRYISFFRKKADISSVEILIAGYLPVYSVWTFIVTFGFPFLFSFK